MNRQYSDSKTNEKRIRKVLIILIGIAVAIAAAFFVLRGCDEKGISPQPTPTPVYLEDDGSSLDGKAETKSRDEILEELQRQQLVVTDKLSSNITFPSGEIGTVGEWVVENPAENNIIQQAEVYLMDKLIAKSTPIYPDQHITGVTLLDSVEPGDYEVIAYLNYYDINTKEFISKAGYKIHLTVRE